MHTFEKYSDFIRSDSRINRKPPVGYTVTPERMLARHQVLLPRESVENSSVLDLGCCVAASGAWVLDHGAAEYVGVELQKEFAEQAVKNLSDNFPAANWQIIQSSLEDFFTNCSRQFDVVFASGVIYCGLYYQELLKNIATITKRLIVIESSVPDILAKNNPFGRFHNIEFYPVVEYCDPSNGTQGKMININNSNYQIRSAIPSVGSLDIFLREFGFCLDTKSYHDFKSMSDTGWPNRFGATFVKTSKAFSQSTENLYKNQSQDIVPWKLDIPDTWTFDDNVARSFVQHARQHVPDYDRVIDLSVGICRMMLEDPPTAKILDVGCATGETLNRLYYHGHYNLIGVDSSQAMLDYCDKNRARYICSEDFPSNLGPYHAVLCNWTLHFIREKQQYLYKIYRSLLPGGFLILTEKTHNHGLPLELYHEFKRHQKVSEEEIQAKAKSVANIMFIDPIDWYLKNLSDMGFVDVSIINAAPCFTTFLAFRPGVDN